MDVEVVAADVEEVGAAAEGAAADAGLFAGVAASEAGESNGCGLPSFSLCWPTTRSASTIKSLEGLGLRRVAKKVNSAYLTVFAARSCT